MSEYNLLLEDSIKNICEEEYHKIWNVDTGSNIFTSYAYFKALEESNCIGENTGWEVNFFLMKKRNGELSSLTPCFLKYHSYGEYVFDWSWAEAYHRAGERYYPKLVIASPFTPISGSRLLGTNTSEEIDTLRNELELWCEKNSLSSVHILFCRKKELDTFEKKDWLVRKTVQFHWRNNRYTSFEDFLNSLQQKKRKKIRSERKKVVDRKVICEVLSGDEIEKKHMHFLYNCYKRTYADHFSTPYLNYEFFNLLYEKLRNNLVISLAYDIEKKPIACSLAILELNNEKRTLYGRYWGSIEPTPFLHFEVAYYRLIEWSILHNIEVFEGGAQGEHKLARGFEPVITNSLHWICNKQYRAAIKKTLITENLLIEQYLESLKARSAYHKKKI